MRNVSTGEFEGGSVFIDGDWKPLSEAKISMFDWGFTRSDVDLRRRQHLEGRVLSHRRPPRPLLRQPRQAAHDDPVQPRRGAADPARLRQGRRPAGRLRGDAVHARRAAARRARPAPGAEPLLRLRAALSCGSPARKSRRRASTCTSASASASRRSRSIRRSRTTTGSTSCMSLFDAYDRGADTSCVVDAEGNVAEGPGLQRLHGQGRRRAHARPRRARGHLAQDGDRAVRHARHPAARRAGAGRRSAPAPTRCS